jgi:hypothetical protein
MAVMNGLMHLFETQAGVLAQHGKQATTPNSEHGALSQDK